MTESKIWNESTLYDATFRDSGGAYELRVRISVPHSESDRTSVCQFQILGLGDGRIMTATGSDSLQSVSIATEHIRRCLMPLNVLETVSELPPELIFGRRIPICYGLEFMKYLEARMDSAIARKEVKIADRRRRRQNSALEE